jgi:O-antigen/teichoic acid export membrane protein
MVLTVLFVLLNNYDWQKSILIFILVGQRIFDSVADVLYGIMQKKRQLYISGKSLLYKSALSLVVFLFIDLLTNNLLLSAMSLPIVSLLFILFYDIPNARKLESFSIKPLLINVKAILKSAFLPFTIAVMGLIFVNIARYFIDVYHPELQGYFGIIIMPLSLTTLLFSFISMPATLHLSDRYNNKEFRALGRFIGKIIGIILIATVALCILTYFLGAPLLGLLFNVNFTSYIFDIILVILTGLAVSLTSLFTNIAIIARKLWATAVIYLLSNTCLVILCVLLVNQYKIRGAIIAYIIASVTQTLLMAIYYRHLTK